MEPRGGRSQRLLYFSARHWLLELERLQRLFPFADQRQAAGPEEPRAALELCSAFLRRSVVFVKVQVKEFAEMCLQEKALYRQVLSECLTLRDGRLPGELVQDHVETELSSEVQLCEDTKLLIQQKITEVLDQLRTLKEMRSELLSDQRDKDTAIDVTSLCLALDIQSPSVGYRYQPSSITKGTLTYEQWISHCQNLKESAEKAVLDSSYFRSNLQHKFSELFNALDAQRSATDFSFRWKLDELRRAKESLEWEKQQVKDLVTELQAEMQKVESQILSSGSEEQLAQTRMDILAQRLNHELCLDQPTTGLQQEAQHLYRNTFSLKKKLLLSQKTLEIMYRNLFKLEEGVTEKTRSIEIDEKCQEVRQQLHVLGRMPMILVDPADSHGSSTSAETLHDEDCDGQ
ncbi:tektin-2-like [Salminus brasiliensis]|uniref:tektin-2-like n=1 Tax=Salminus brasiliensis TaxID=930266 RepID=UPI003B837234